MKSINQARGKPFEVPIQTNYVEQGAEGGAPVILIHGLAASLHDWDVLLPELAASGYHGYALDLLGHGDSPKPDSRAYKAKWIFRHLIHWIDSLQLKEPPFIIGHSLGGYLALRYALHHPTRLRGLVLTDPFYRLSQLPPLLQAMYRRARISVFVVGSTPEWMFRAIVNATNFMLDRDGHTGMTLSEQVRLQTALDYKRTAPGVFNLPNTARDLTPDLPRISAPTLVLWGDHDQTLRPESFPSLVRTIPNACGREMAGGHVPHQSNSAEYNRLVLEFLKSR